jgi:uncharacterized protein YegL
MMYKAFFPRFFGVLCLWGVFLFSSKNVYAQPANCLPSDVLMVVDYSCSMGSSTSTGGTRWAATQGAYRTLLTQYANQLRFGLITFSSSAELRVGVGSNTAQQCLNVLNNLSPTGMTAMRCALDIAYQHYRNTVIPADPVKDRRRFVVLMTDGEPNNCGSDVVPPIRSLFNELGVKTYVIGFGTQVGSNTLQSMATAGGTGTFYRADNQTDLFRALNDIATGATKEICDNKDNDCDGVVDNFTEVCQGNCGRGERTCTAGVWSECSSNRPTGPEICDNIDNDCDGKVDEGLNRPCNNACGNGTETCVAGEWKNCSAPRPGDEDCNGLDDDCDGKIDENLSRPCQTACGKGTQACIQGDWTVCSARMPQQEVCNGLDDDCNGKVDDNAVCPNNGVCRDGECIRRCSPECPRGFTCMNGLCEQTPCPNPCAEGERCQYGRCLPGNCALPGAECLPEQICRGGDCQKNLCENIQCPAGQFCRPYDGQCRHSCSLVQCGAGETCENGSCVANPCAGVNCPSGEACLDGLCVAKSCPASGCPQGQACISGQCMDDPCYRVTCPNNQRCIRGECYGATGPTPDPDGTPNPDGTPVDGGADGVPNPDDPNTKPEVNMDDPNDPNHPNNPNNPNSPNNPNNPNYRGREACACSAQTASSFPVTFLLLFLLWPMAVRRKSQR